MNKLKLSAALLLCGYKDEDNASLTVEAPKLDAYFAG